MQSTVYVSSISLFAGRQQVQVPVGAEPLNAIEHHGMLDIFWRIPQDNNYRFETRDVVIALTGSPIPDDQPYGFLASVMRQDYMSPLHVFTDLTHTK